MLIVVPPCTTGVGPGPPDPNPGAGVVLQVERPSTTGVALVPRVPPVAPPSTTAVGLGPPVPPGVAPSRTAVLADANMGNMMR